MGLDQYAYSKAEVDSTEPEFVWRKHAKLHKFMEDLWYAQREEEVFNTTELSLSKDDIDKLRKAIENNKLPESEGGLFFGHQWQDDSCNEYKEQDLKFCDWADEQLDQGYTVVYNSWW